MSGNHNSQNLVNQQGVLFGALCVFIAFIGGCWFFAYHAYTLTPATETITVTLPPEMIAGKAGLAEPPQTVEVERLKPGREYLGALLHPFGFMILMLAIIAVGGVVALVGVRYGRE
jgi:hypothetical protein